MDNRLSPRTVVVAAGRPSGTGAPLNQPIVLASNFRGGGEYSRTHGTESWAALEEAIGALEGGRALAFSSGMAAAAAALYALAPKVLVLPTFCYLGVRSLVEEYRVQGHIEVRPVEVTDTVAMVAAAAGADVVWIETPTNPTLDVADVAAICAAATTRVRGERPLSTTGDGTSPHTARSGFTPSARNQTSARPETCHSR